MKSQNSLSYVKHLKILHDVIHVLARIFGSSMPHSLQNPYYSSMIALLVLVT